MLRRAVFSDIQRKGLERRFQVQKYISKPDRKKLADQLGLKDSQVRSLTILKFCYIGHLPCLLMLRQTILLSFEIKNILRET